MRLGHRLLSNCLDSLDAKQIEGAAGCELIGDGVADFAGDDACWRTVNYVRDGVAIGCNDHRVHVPVVVGCVAVHAQWKLATAAENFEHGTLGLCGELGVDAVESADGFEDGRVGFVKLVGAGFESERTLAGSGCYLVDGEALVNVFGAADTVETG